MEIPILKVSVQKDQFSIITKILPAHEYPIFLVAWGQENLEIIGKSEEVHKIDSIESEVKTYGVYSWRKCTKRSIWCKLYRWYRGFYKSYYREGEGRK